MSGYLTAVLQLGNFVSESDGVSVAGNFTTLGLGYERSAYR